MTFEQQRWDKWADDDEERSWLIPDYRKEPDDGKEEQKAESTAERIAVEVWLADVTERTIKEANNSENH